MDTFENRNVLERQMQIARKIINPQIRIRSVGEFENNINNHLNRVWPG